MSSATSSKESSSDTTTPSGEFAVAVLPPPPTYRLYKRRHVGIVGLVVLNISAAMIWPWFGPISNNTAAEFGISLDQVNWLGNVVTCVYLPAALLIPMVIARYGIRRCCDIGAVSLVLSAWIRYAGTVRSLSPRASYALLMIGQIIGALAQPIYQVLGPKYSETWYGMQARTTATMIVAISNPIGGALGQLLSPIFSTTRKSILVLGIITTAAAPFVFAIASKPPTPPTFSGSKSSPPLMTLLRALGGQPTPAESRMSNHERIDFAIITVIFGTLVAATNTFAILSAQILQPVGYSATDAGLMGACLLLSGIVAAIITAPLFDRVFTNHLALTLKLLVPVVSVLWLTLIWAVKPHNAGGLFAIMALIGVCSITMLPVALELGCELTRNADGSSAILWFTGSLVGIAFVLVQSALRAGPDANPPFNMRRTLIFNGAFILPSAMLIFLVHGVQARQALDKEKRELATQA